MNYRNHTLMSNYRHQLGSSEPWLETRTNVSTVKYPKSLHLTTKSVITPTNPYLTTLIFISQQPLLD